MGFSRWSVTDLFIFPDSIHHIPPSRRKARPAEHRGSCGILPLGPEWLQATAAELLSPINFQTEDYFINKSLIYVCQRCCCIDISRLKLFERDKPGAGRKQLGNTPEINAHYITHNLCPFSDTQCVCHRIWTRSVISDLLDIDWCQIANCLLMMHWITFDNHYEG